MASKKVIEMDKYLIRKAGEAIDGIQSMVDNSHELGENQSVFLEETEKLLLPIVEKIKMNTLPKITLKLLKEHAVLILDTSNDMLRMSYPNGQVEFLTNRQAEWNVSTYNHHMFLFNAGQHIVVEIVE